MTIFNEADALLIGSTPIDAVYVGTELVWSSEVPMASYRDTVMADTPLVFFRLHEADANSHADEMGGPSANNNPWGEANSQAPSVLPNGEGFSVDMKSPNRAQGLSAINPKLVGLGDIFSVELWLVQDVDSNPYNMWVQDGFVYGNSSWGFGHANGTVWVMAGGEDNREHPGPFSFSKFESYHMVLTVDDTAMQLYKNGILDQERTIRNGAAVGGGNLSIGSYGNNLNGRFQELAVYDYVLSAERVAAHYQAGLSPLSNGSDYISEIMTDTPLSFWPLNDGAGTVAADIVGSHPGVYEGGYQHNVRGPDNAKALRLDGLGASRVSVPSFAFPPDPSPVTLELWVRPEVGISYYGLITKCLGNASDPYDWYVFANGADQFFSSGNSVSAPNLVMGGVWHHLVAVHDADATIHLYHDGVEVGSGAGGRRAGRDAGLLLFGNRPDNATAFKGRMAYVAIYNHALSSDRILEHYQVGLTT